MVIVLYCTHGTYPKYVAGKTGICRGEGTSWARALCSDKSEVMVINDKKREFPQMQNIVIDTFGNIWLNEGRNN